MKFVEEGTPRGPVALEKDFMAEIHLSLWATDFLKFSILNSRNARSKSHLIDREWPRIDANVVSNSGEQ